MAAWKDGLHQLCFLKFSLYSDVNPLLKPHKPLPVEQKRVCDEGIPFHVTAFHVIADPNGVALYPCHACQPFGQCPGAGGF